MKSRTPEDADLQTVMLRTLTRLRARTVHTLESFPAIFIVRITAGDINVNKWWSCTGRCFASTLVVRQPARVCSHPRLYFGSWYPFIFEGFPDPIQRAAEKRSVWVHMQMASSLQLLRRMETWSTCQYPHQPVTPWPFFLCFRTMTCNKMILIQWVCCLSQTRDLHVSSNSASPDKAIILWMDFFPTVRPGQRKRSVSGQNRNSSVITGCHMGLHEI